MDTRSLILRFVAQLLDFGLQPGTARTYRVRLEHFADWLGLAGLAPAELKRDQAQAWIQYLRVEKKLSDKTRRDAVSIARCFFNWLLEREQVEKNPFLGLRPIKVKEKVRIPLRMDQALDLVEAAGDLTDGASDAVIVELLYGSGLRRGELLTLDLGHIDMVERQALIHGKGGKERLQEISEPAIAAIKEWLPRRDEILRKGGREGLQALLVTRQGRMGRETLRKVLNGIAARAGIERRVFPHLLRHTFATHMLRNGADLRSVQELLGHAQLATTQKYTHLDREDIRKVYLESHPRARETPPPKPAAEKRRRVNGPPARRGGAARDTGTDLRFRLISPEE